MESGFSYNNDEYDYAMSLQRLLRNYKQEKNKQEDLRAQCLITKAFMYAMVAHDNVRRKSGEAYVTHPIAVALGLEKKQADYQTICGALLHDTIEDCDWITRETIEKEFGENIATKVYGVTKVSIKDVSDKKHQIILTQNKLVISIIEDLGIIEIKIEDRKHNMSTINGHKDPKKRKEIAAETLDIYVPLARHFGQYNDKELLEGMSFRILHPHIDKKIRDMKSELIHGNKELSKLLFDLQYDASPRSIKKELIKQGINVYDVEYKLKENPGIYRQLKKGKKFDKIPDLMTFIIKVDTVDDVYRALQVINKNSVPINEGEYQMKDHISHPKYPYYRALHTYNIVESEGKKYLLHFQIQTMEMWRESVDGIASKWKYNVNDEGALEMKKSLTQDFPFYEDLKRLIDEYKRGDISDIDFNKKVKHLILPRQIYINMGDFTHEETYDGSTIKDFVIRLCRKGKIDKICPNQEYYINGCKKDLNYKLKDEDTFEIRIKKPEVMDSEGNSENSFQRTKKQR